MMGGRTLEVMMGRKLEVTQCKGHAVRFTFKEICGEALGAADYVALAKSSEIVFVDG